MEILASNRGLICWCLLMSAALAGCGEKTTQLPPQGEKRDSNAIQTITSAIGSLRGVPVFIPAEYIFLPVQYEQKDLSPGPPTFETPIQSISLRVRLPDMAPRTAQNEKDWRESLRGSLENSAWIPVDIYSTFFDAPGPAWIKRWIDGMRAWVEGARTKKYVLGWHYQKIEEKRYALITEVLVGLSPKEKNKFHAWNKDILYDAEHWQTAIECGSGPTARPNGKHICRQFFPLPEMNAYVAFQYSLDKLKDWKTMQDKLAVLIRQFAVKDSPAKKEAEKKAVSGLDPGAPR